MKRLLTAIAVLTAVSSGLGFYLSSIGVDGSRIALHFGLPRPWWPVAMPMFGLTVALFMAVVKRPLLERLAAGDELGKPGLATAAGLLFGPLLALLMQIFLGLKSFDLIDKAGMLTGVALMQLIMFAIVGNYTAAARRGRGQGFRTPWTARSDVVWLRTQRFVGRALVFLSLLGLAALFFAQPLSVIFAHFASVLAVKFLATAYSFRLWRRERLSRERA